MIPNTTKPKRGREFTIAATGQTVYLERIVDYEHYFVCTGKGMTLEDEFFKVKIEDLKHPQKEGQQINKVSESKKEQDKIYATLRKVFLENHPVCEARLPGCSKKSTEVHHKAGRVGKNYIDIHTFLAVCPACHRWIELHPTSAKEKGFSTDRL